MLLNFTKKKKQILRIVLKDRIFRKNVSPNLKLITKLQRAQQLIYRFS